MHTRWLIIGGCYFCAMGAMANSTDVLWESHVRVRPIPSQIVNSIEIVPQKININTANRGQLLKLVGIGPKKADSLLAYRLTHGAFKKFNDLSKVKGFSKKTLARILELNKDLIEVN